MIQEKIKKLIHFLLAFSAYWLYGRPARKLIVIGVTGTKGKSTTCRLIASVLEAAGYKVGMLTTVEFQIGDRHVMNDKKMTMLGRGQIQKILRAMVREGCTYAVVETSSEGILQYRNYGLHYDVALFTNLGSEHSERHGGFENLRHDKGKMFAALSESRKKIGGKIVPKIIVANGDDPEAGFYLSYPADKKIVYGFDKSEAFTASADLIHAKKSEVLKSGSCFDVGTEKYCLNIIGEFNRYNGLAAVAVGMAQGLSAPQIRQGLASVDLVPGRMEFIDEGQPFQVVVDYAHEPLSLAALFNTLRTLVEENHGKVVAVVGSDGGGRDKQKRAKMGEVAGRLADLVVISDVNCFDEDPRQIAEMLAVGAREAGKRDGEDLFIEVDRREGVKKAFSLAGSGDVVAITAKGTEPVICVAGGKKIPWDDRLVARDILREKYVFDKQTSNPR